MGFKTKPKNDVTATQVLELIKTIDGLNSGLDSDLLQGKTPSEIVYENISETDPNVSNLVKSINSPNDFLEILNLAIGKIKSDLISEISWNLLIDKPNNLTDYGIIDAQPLNSELIAFQQLGNVNGFIKKSGNNSYSIDNSNYLTVETDPTVPEFVKGLYNENEVLRAINQSSGMISADRIPSTYVDDIYMFLGLDEFPTTGDSTKIYLAENTNRIYRWSGVSYVDISSGATADNALKLAVARTISNNQSSDISFSFNFDGSINIETALTLKNINATFGTFPKVAFNSKGLVTSGSNLESSDIPDLDWSKITSGINQNISFLADNNNNPPNWHVYVPTRNYGNNLIWTPATINSSLENTILLRNNQGGITAFNGVFTSTETATNTTTGAIRGNSLGITGNIYAGFLFGDGSGINNINASNILSGTINASRLPASYLPLAGGTLTGDLISSSVTASTSTTTGAIRANSLGITGAGYFGTLFGNGAGITALNASNISSGTINVARLPASYLPLIGGTLTGDLISSSTTVSTSTTTGAIRASSIGITGAGYFGTLFGDGAGISNIDASNLALGVIPNARISGAYTNFTNISGTGIFSLTPTYSANANRIASNIISTIDNTAALTANRTSYGLFSRVDNTLNSTNKSTFNHIIYGGGILARNAINLTDDSGVTELYGCFNSAENRAASGTILNNIVGSFNRFLCSGSLGINISKASYNYAVVTGSSAIGSLTATDSNIFINNSGASINSAYGTSNIILNSAGTVTNVYGIYNSFTGNFGTKWGIYSDGDSKNYLTGNLGLGIDPTVKLDVNGSGRISGDLNITSTTVATSTTTGAIRAASLGITGAGWFGNLFSSSLRLTTSNTIATATTTGTLGDIRWDANFIYVCVATNTWKRAALSTW